MCGIVGLISKWKFNGLMMSQQKMFDQLLFADQLRGNDATGVIAVYKDGGFATMKEASDAYGFAYSYKGSDVDKDAFKKGVALIGHNRAKTVGENKDENAHPFVEDKTFAMVHNGTLRNHKLVNEVDSHDLTIKLKKAMDEEDWKTGLEKALGEVEGAFACVWYDQKRETINMIRNSERPLSLIETGSEIIFCSEANLGIWIAARNNCKIDKVTHIPVMTLFTFDTTKQGGDWSETFLSPKYPMKGYSNGIHQHGGKKAMEGPFEANSKTLLDRIADAKIKDVAKAPEGDPVGGDSRAELSKNAFKKLRATVMGREVGFWVADYVDQVNDNSGNCTQALVIGESLDGAYDLCEVRHVIRGVVEMKPLGLKESDFFGSVRMRGKIYDAEYDKDLMQAIFRVQNCSVEEISGEVVH